MPKINNKQKEVINLVIQEPLDDSQIRHYLPQAKIMKYSEFKNFNSIDDVLKKDKDYVVILYEDAPSIGHWCTLLRYGNIIEFWDSYGNNPTKILSWVPKAQRIKLDQWIPYLSNLLDKTNHDVIYNTTKFQSSKPNTNDCGAYCVFRIINMMKYNRDLPSFCRLMDNLKRETGLTYDQVVRSYISIL